MPALSANSHGPRIWLGRERNMQIRGESDFGRKPVLENCAFFTCVQCGYCGYLILGGSATELRDEEERHAIECKATHGLIGVGKRSLAHSVVNEYFSESFANVSRARKVLAGTMSTAWWQYDCDFRRRQQRLKEIQGCEWVLIFSWLGALLIWGFLWWAAFRLLCCMVQLVQYAPGLLR
jgi:hypothetical protein